MEKNLEHSRILEFLEFLDFFELLFMRSVSQKHTLSNFSNFSKFEDFFLGKGLWGPGQGPQRSWARAFGGRERTIGIYSAAEGAAEGAEEKVARYHYFPLSLSVTPSLSLSGSLCILLPFHLCSLSLSVSLVLAWCEAY